MASTRFNFWQTPTVTAAQITKEKRYTNFDVRVGRTVSDSARTAQETAARLQGQAIGDALVALRNRVPGAEVRISPLTAAVEIVRGKSALTAAAQGREGGDIVREFMQTNRGLYGLSTADINNLRFIGESRSAVSGLRMVRVEQIVNGRPVFQSETRFVLDRDGRLHQSTGLFAPNAGANAGPLTGLLTAQTAVAKALESVGILANVNAMTLANTSSDGFKTEIVANDSRVAGNVAGQIVYFPLAPGTLVPAWSLLIFTDGDADWYALVDARSGNLLWRKNMRNHASTHDARFRVYVQADGKTPADNPAPQSPTTAAPGGGTQFPEILPTIVSMLSVQNLVASPNGWINDCPGGGCTANETQTIGNNVHAYMDRAAPANVPDTDAASVLDGNGKPTGNPDGNGRNRDFLGTAPRDFQTGFLPPPQGGAANAEVGQTATGAGNNGTLAIDQFRRAAVVSLFYTSNWYHDQLYALGFDEAAGNFQSTNFSGMGLGGDSVQAEVQDNSGTNNANFSTPPDGSVGRMQMFRFTGPTIDRDGDLDNEIVIHELTHGLSNRLVGNAAGLGWDPGGGMGEGWSDFYALSLLNNTNADDPNASYATGAYATYKLIGGYTDNYVYGIRRFPYSTNNSVNPLTWADIDDSTNNLSGGIASSPVNFNDAGGMEVHNAGEIWALTLWEVRARVIAANANDVPTGNQKTLQIVTDALKLTPISPSFTDGRDALFTADCAANACANEDSIWGGFADRGLGYKSSTSSAIAFGFSAGHLGVKESFDVPYLDYQSVAIDDSLGNNNGAIDPGEPIKLTVTLTNPWRSASKNVASATATLTSLTAGVVVVDGSSNYPAIAAQGSAAGDTFVVTIPTTATCGQSLNFTLTPTSTLGSRAVDFSLRVGTLSGTGAPITYTRTLPAPLAIPDNRGRGVADTLTITDDYEIADIDFRLDSLTHTFTGDVTAMLKAPNGYGNDYVSLIGALIDGGSGDNITNMVIDDDIASTAANDMVQAAPAAAPYTKSWLPVFNAPWPALAGFPAGDSVGQLSRLDGTSTLGVWTVVVSDQFAADTGSLNAWSIIVTPKAYTCTPFTPTVAVTGTKTATGTLSVGGTVTYTITLTNNGSATQADNPGNEFTDVLPASLTLVSATATTGTAVATIGTNTVTWNGSLPLLGGSTTITITATINSAGPIANQGTISFDANVDGTNEASTTTDDPALGGPNDSTVINAAKANTTTAILSDLPDPSVIGQSYAIMAAVSVVAPGIGTPTGTITVSDGTNSCTITLPATSCNLPSTTVGAKTLTASYGGDANFNVSAAPTTPHTVNKADTTTTIVSDLPDASVIGQNYDVTVSVAVTAPGSGTPTGTVTVSDGTNICTVTLPATSCSLPSTSVGAKSLTASYGGDASFNVSAAPTAPHTVNKADTTTAILSDTPDPSAVGQSYTVTASVTVNPPGAASKGQAVTVATSGTVTVSDGTNSCVITLPATSCSLTSTSAGNKTLVATYSGDANFNGSISAGAAHTVFATGEYPDTSAASDQKAGSVLVYPIYSSSAANASAQNTRIAITNTNATLTTYVHLFFVDGSTCSVADSYICLTPNQTAALLASDVDPGTTGYLVAVAVTSSGCPANFNFLVGDEYVKLASGHASNLGAEAIASIAGGLPACNPLTDNNAVLAFNNVSYNALPRVLASSNIPSRGDGNDSYVVINRIGGNLSTAGSAIGGFFGILYDDAEAAYSFSLAASACQSAGSITNDRPRTVPRIETVIPSGRSGWFKIWGAADIGILGAQINRNANATTNAGAFNHGHNLHKLTYTTTTTITIPVFPPSC